MTRTLKGLALAWLIALLPVFAFAGDVKISGLPAASSIGATDVVPITQGTCPSCATNGATGTQLKTWAQSGLATVATSGSASDLGAGTLPAARLPAPTTSAFGGVWSKTCPSHQWIDVIPTSAAAPTCAQPAAADVSGLAASATTDTTVATNITTGTLPAAQLPNPSASTLGGVQSKASASHQWLNAISTSGVPSASQPASSDLSDTVGITSFTPTIDFTTPGDRTVVYTTQTGKYAKIGPLTCVWYSLVFTPTYTTAAGNFVVSAPPVAPTDANVWAMPIGNFSAPTWPVADTMIGMRWNGTGWNAQGMKSGFAAGNFSVTQIVSGTTYTLIFSGCYF